MQGFQNQVDYSFEAQEALNSFLQELASNGALTPTQITRELLDFLKDKASQIPDFSNIRECYLRTLYASAYRDCLYATRGRYAMRIFGLQEKLVNNYNTAVVINNLNP